MKLLRLVQNDVGEHVADTIVRFVTVSEDGWSDILGALPRSGDGDIVEELGLLVVPDGEPLTVPVTVTL